MHPSYQKLVNASADKNREDLQTLYVSLIVEKMKLDKFFSMFLDRFDEEMNCEDSNTPVWKLYRSKTKEYAELSQTVKIAEYYINKT